MRKWNWWDALYSGESPCGINSMNARCKYSVTWYRGVFFMWHVYYIENTYNLIKQWTTTYLLKRHSYHCFLPWQPKAQVITSGRNHNQTDLFIDKTTSPITRWRVEYRQAITRFLYFVLVTTLLETMLTLCDDEAITTQVFNDMTTYMSYYSLCYSVRMNFLNHLEEWAYQAQSRTKSVVVAKVTLTCIFYSATVQIACKYSHKCISSEINLHHLRWTRFYRVLYQDFHYQLR